MTIRRDYTNGSGYICPAENEAIRNLDRPKEKPVTPRPYKNVLREQEIKRMERPTPMQALAQIAARGAQDAQEAKDAENLKKARQLMNILTTIAQMVDFSVTGIELKPKGSPVRYYRDETTQTMEKRC
jgi:hypothetical protein